MPTKFFATCPKNLEGLLEEELISLGAHNTKQTIAGVNFDGESSLAYRVCLWSRLANRVLLPLASFMVESADDLYDGVRDIKWLDHLQPSNSLAVDFTGVSFAITNSHFGALKVKDAIVDQLRESTGTRPNIDKENPDIRINVYLYNDIANVSIDLSGDSLHRRGYRSSPGAAPLKENLAAAVLYRSGWAKFAEQGKPLLDPMCGSGTILIEAAMIAQDYAPGLLREYFGFIKWRKHDRRIWKSLWDEAKERREQGKQKFKAKIYGYDVDSDVAASTKSYVRNADLTQVIKVDVCDVKEVMPPENISGLIVTNPPYGMRLYDEERLADLYSGFGVTLRERFLNWEVALLTGNPDLGKTMGIRSHKQYNFFNGAIPCKLLLFHVTEAMFWREYKGTAVI